MQIKFLGIFFLFLTKLALAQTKFSQESIADSARYYIKEANESIFNDFEIAKEELIKAKNFVDQTEDAALKAEVARKFAIAYYIKGEYYNSLSHFLEAEGLYRKAGDWVGIGKCLNGLGLIQQGIDRHKEAIEYFKQARDYYNLSKDKYASTPAVINLGISELQSGDLDHAKATLDSALIMAIGSGRKDIEHVTLNHLGDLAYKKDQINTALTYFERVVNDSVEPNNWEKAFSYYGLAKVDLALNNLYEAERYGLKALDFAKANESFYELERITGVLFNIYEAKGELEKAILISKQNRAYRDSLYDQKRTRAINVLNLEQKEADNRRLRIEKMEKDKELSKNKLIIAVLLTLGFILILILFFWVKNYQQKEQFRKALEEKNRLIVQKNDMITERNIELAKLNKSKDRLFSILSHDLKSPIGSIQKLLELIKSGEFTQKEQAELLDEMLKQVSATSSMLQNLLQWANSQLEGSKVYMEEVILPKRVKEIMDAHYLVAKAKNIRMIHEIPSNMSPVFVDNGHLSIILHNLISNAIKFTHPGKEIKIHYSENEGCVLFKVKDGGDGISKERIDQIQNFNTQIMSELGTDMETGTGIGLLLVKQFLMMNNAYLQIKSYLGEGSEFIICFSKNKD
ncbi:tetratricopeptide repeat-containing sensor histidine kinase [Zunongwangia pacifica]|uniref:histidine kinase n=1 Tax=Zunongwangia pacifica TaxID=2911062 RepID=A0A9X1ZTB1_9FLAO|nr:tetratricopeptide repeat protein [Zunongwangia pacifica]MCL6218053.1 tetratricopeptide repeat protein [Zunongwangia pacifica]